MCRDARDMYLHKQAEKQTAERLLQHKRVALRQATATYDAIRAGTRSEKSICLYEFVP